MPESTATTEPMIPAPQTPPLTPIGATCDVDACGEPAVASYVWAWGQTGCCCARHQFILSQKSKNLKRAIQFAPLAPGAPSEPTRDERVQYRAQILAAEDELQAAKGRTAKTYAQNQELIAEVKRLTALNSELDGQLSQTRARLDETLRERDETLVSLHEARDELVRLQTLNDALEGSHDPH
jgi:hypothetical protein